VNIAFFLVPKKDVAYLSLNCTMRQAIEKMEYHGYTAVPLIDDEGRYAGTINEGDLLRMLKNSSGFNYGKSERILLRNIPQQIFNSPVRADAKIGDLLSLAITQNFIPVVDDHGVFIGIIRRREIIEYCLKLVLENNKKDSQGSLDK